MSFVRRLLLLLVPLAVLALGGCNGQAVKTPAVTPQPAFGAAALDLSSLVDTAAFVKKIADKRVVFIGEKHDRYEHHLNQLAVIAGLHAQEPNLAIGLEQFQRPFQAVLDDYIAGEIDVQTLLKRSEWYKRWRFDYRLYAPILEFAREQGIPLLALNADKEITRQIGKSGIDSLDAAQRSQIAREIDRSDVEYINSLKRVFHSHPGWQKRNFEQFVDVQLVWDETMAETVADYLLLQPKRRVVVLAGSGHIAYRSGIPDRLARRLPVSQVTAVQGIEANGEMSVGMADWLLLPEPVSLPAAGKMGILMDDSELGVVIEEVVEDSGAARGGLTKGDIIIELGGVLIADTADVRIQLLGKPPGTVIGVSVRRDEDGGSVEVQMTVELTGL